MMTLGVGSTWGQPFTVTTDPSAPHYYLIQSAQVESFYIIPKTDNPTDDTEVTTTNVPNENMLWYFMDAGSNNGTQYYYIIHKSGLYLYRYNDSDKGIKLHSASTADSYKFSIEATGDYYFIKPKGKNYVNKKGGNVGWDNGLKNSTAVDGPSQWKFIDASSPLPWSFPFTASTNTFKTYYKIKNQTNTSFFVSINTSTNKVNTSNAANDDNMIWYFEEVPVGVNGSDDYITYHYIRHAKTGKYMHFDGTVQDNAQDNAASVQDKTSENETKCQFIIVKAARTEKIDGVDVVIECYSIIPRELKDKYWKNHCIAQKNTTSGTNVQAKTDRGSQTNTTNWNFEQTTFSGVWADPEITCDATGTVTITFEDGATVYYTTEDHVPTTDDNAYVPSSKPTVSNGITTIKARAIAIGKDPSNVVIKTIVLNPTITLTAGSYTYTGTAQNPVSSVDYVDAENSENNIHFTETTQYTVSYKKGNDAVPECKNAGIYTIVLNDADGDEYFIYGTGSFTIDQKALTVTAKPKTITYGEVPSNDGVEYDSFADNEDASVLGGELAYAYNYSQYGDAGSYTITPSGLTATNYDITFVSGMLTVNPKEVGLTWSTPTSFTYDGAAHALTVNVSGAENGDAIEVTVTTTAKEGSSLTEGNAINAGTYTATISELTGNKAGNYTLPTTPAQDFTISKKSATVSGITVSDKTYDGTTTATINRDEEVIDGILPGDDVSITDVTGTFADANADINSKAVNVVITTDGTSVGNYELSVPGGLTAKINRRLLKITANDNTISYGAAAVDNDVNYDSFAIGDDESLLEGTLTYSFNTLDDGTGDPYTTTSPKGSSFYIIPDGLHLPDGNNNYTITFAPGTLTVEAKSIGDETNLASGFDVAFDTDGNIKLYDGTSELTSNDYEETGTPTTSESGRYVTRTIQGKGNYTGSAKVREAIVNLANDGGTGAYYGTFVAECTDPEVGHALPEGITAYIIKSSDINGRVVTPTALTYIPKDVPVLLMSATNKDGFLVKSGTGTDDTTGNLLKEVTSSTPNFIDDVNSDYNQKAYFNVANIYLLYKNEFVLNKAGYLAKGKVYMEKPSGGSGARLKISKGDDTGIENIEYTIDSQSGAWYTLDGRRLSSKPTKKGLYLQSGKKIVVK